MASTRSGGAPALLSPGQGRKRRDNPVNLLLILEGAWVEKERTAVNPCEDRGLPLAQLKRQGVDGAFGLDPHSDTGELEIG